MSTATLLRFADVVERAKQAAQGREDYVNAAPYPEDHPLVLEGEADAGDTPECRYLENDNSPSCIVGAAFHAEIRDVGISADHPLNVTGVGSLFQEALWDRYQLTHRAYHFLATLQNHQDGGKPWGEAIQLAEEASTYYGDDTKAMPEYFL